MKHLLTRVYATLCSLLCSVCLLGQDLDDIDMDGGMGKRSSGDDMDAIGMMTDYQPMRFTMSDIFMVVMLLVACYVFGKIWKGCSYLLLILAAIFYYMMH